MQYEIFSLYPVLKWIFVNLPILLNNFFHLLIFLELVFFYLYESSNICRNWFLKKIWFLSFLQIKRRKGPTTPLSVSCADSPRRLQRAPAKLLRLSTRLSKAPTNTSQACNSYDEAARLRRHSATKISPRFKNSRRAAAARSRMVERW